MKKLKFPKLRFPKWKKKTTALVLCGVMAASVATGAFFVFGDKEAESGVISVGLQQFADEAYLACSAQVGQEISFTPDFFDKTLQGGAVSAVTVTALPPVTEGRLLLGEGEVSVGQLIPRETLSYLRFVPTGEVRESSFEFVPTTLSGSSGYALCCRLVLTDAENCCPEGKGSVTAVATHTSLSLSGTLVADDPDGDALCFEVVSYPQNGTLTLSSATGAFSYEPNEGFVGNDGFTWRAQDACGAFSEQAEVSITVRELTTGYLFADVENDNVQSAALHMASKGLMGGEMTGGKHYFHPERALTRAAFVCILLDAAEIKVSEADSTGFSDDADIPAPMKGAIRYAKEQGWLGDEESFRPGDAITRAEAAKIAAAVLGLSAPGYHETVEDFSAIPVDAADALYAIYEGGYISTLSDGTLAPMGELSRGDAAKFFSKILDGKQ